MQSCWLMCSSRPQSLKDDPSIRHRSYEHASARHGRLLSASSSFGLSASPQRWGPGLVCWNSGAEPSEKATISPRIQPSFVGLTSSRCLWRRPREWTFLGILQPPSSSPLPGICGCPWPNRWNSLLALRYIERSHPWLSSPCLFAQIGLESSFSNSTNSE